MHAAQLIVPPQCGVASARSPSSPFLREDTPRGFKRGIPPSGDGKERPSREAGREHLERDAFDQWGALFQREGRGAYTVWGPHGTFEEQESRVKLCLWCYRVVDRFQVDRGTVSVAFSYFDRMVSTGLVEKDEWPLALMSCLYVALKICSSAMCRIATPGEMAFLSRGLFKREDVLAMELRICKGFDWLLNPPVAYSYINVISGLLRHDRMMECGLNQMSNGIEREEAGHYLVQQVRYLCDRSVLDVFFSDKRPSSVAYAAVLVSLSIMSFPERNIKWFVSLPLEYNLDEMILCVTRLHMICRS